MSGIYYERPFDDENGDMALWQTGSIKVPVCTFHKFCTIRKTNFPLMKIQPPSEDICLQCHVFKNQFKYSLKQKHKDEDEDNDDLSEIGIGLEVNNQKHQAMDDLEEDIVLHAAAHVKQAKAQ